MKSAAKSLSFSRRKIGACFALLLLAFLICTYSVRGKQQSSGVAHADSSPYANAGAEFTSPNGYPELRIGGQPFFVHAAQFDYFSIPRDLWEHSLESYKDLGFNSIALRIPWNWHEPTEGDLDFDGHTNLRRDLRSLLSLISNKGFKLIAAPGPDLGPALAERWPHGGYPQWLLSLQEFRVDALARLEGADAPAEQFAETTADGAASLWLDNEPHLHYARQWLAGVARELVPYSVSTNSRGEKSGAPLLFVILDSAVALQSASPEKYWRYTAFLKQSLTSAGLDARSVVIAAGERDAVVRPPTDNSFVVAGRWPFSGYSSEFSASAQESILNSRDDAYESIPLLVQSLRLSESYPAFVSAFSDPRTQRNSSMAASQSAVDHFLEWCGLVTQGVGGVIHSDVQRTLPPPGYLMNPHADEQFAALDFSGDPLPSAERARRERDIVIRLGPFFANAHRRTVLGIVDWRTGDAFADAVAPEMRIQAERASGLIVRQIERVATLANVPVELADPIALSSTEFVHDPVLLLAFPEILRAKEFLSASAQNSLLDFVRRGGSLICVPELPVGNEFAQALRGADVGDAGDGATVRNLQKGRVIVWTKLFYEWVHADENLAESRARTESAWAVDNLRTMVTRQSVNLSVLRSDPSSDELLVSELISNGAEPDNKAAAPQPCVPGQRCAEGILSVANWSDSESSETLRILPPSVDDRIASPKDYVELPITLRPRDALFLPLDAPLCSAAKFYEHCEDRVIAAGAELVSSSREGTTLELVFYAPTKATIVLHLAAPPRRVELPERTLEGRYAIGPRTFTLHLPRGAAPDFMRTVKLNLPHVSFVPVTPKTPHTKTRAYRLSVANAIRLPLGEGAALVTSPPLLPLDAQFAGRVLLHVQNLGESLLTLHVDISGPVSALRTIRLDPKERNDYALDVHRTGLAQPGPDGLLHGSLHIAGGDTDSELPLDFVVEDANAALRYRKDFARSGAPDWVLENARLRVIVSPSAGGRISAIEDKGTHTDLLAADGGLHDLQRSANAPQLLDVLSNVAYVADWNSQPDNNAIDLGGNTPEESPAPLQIQKTLRLLDPGTLQIEYHSKPIPQGPTTSGTSLVSEFSFAAFAGGATGTQFCWNADARQAGTSNDTHCESFVPGSQPLRIPEGVTHLEIRTFNRATLALAWNVGSVSIQQENDFARFLWNLPASTPENASQTGLLTLTLGETH